MRLHGKTILVTGGGTGLGLAIAKLFAQEGANVAISGRREDVLAAAAGEIGPKVLAVTADASQPEAMRAAVAATVDRFGALDGLVHSAGVQVARTELLDTDADDFEATLKGNLTSTFVAAREAARVMPEGGAIVLLGSVAGLIGVPGRLSYSAAKAGMVGLLRQSTRHLGARGIRINLIAPGYVLTAMTADVLAEISEQERQRILDAYPLGRIGQAEDVARAALFLASDESAWITGVVLPVDGGLSAEKPL